MRLPLRRGAALVVVAGSMMLITGEATAQHSDIVIGEIDGKIVYEHGALGRVFEGNFGTSGAFEQSTGNPGFATEADEGFILPPSTVIDYNVLGPLTYHDGTDFAPVPAGASITISDNPAGSLTVDAGTVSPATGPRFITQASSSSGSVHQHIDFDLSPLSLDTPDYGAYGLLMELSTYVDSPVSLASSDPFYLVFNFGLEEAQFHHALGDFAAQVPEPVSLGLAGVGVAVVGACRRRRLANGLAT